MKKLSPAGQARIRAKSRKRWLKSRYLIAPAFIAMTFAGMVIGGQIAATAGIEADIGMFAGIIVGVAFGSFYVVWSI